MAGIRANGIGSGLDINSLVSQLVAAEGSAQQQRITRHEVAVTSKISALGTLKGALGAFKSALEPLKSVEAFQIRSATSADPKKFTVSANASAVAGRYDVEVVRLASAHQLRSTAFVGGSSSYVGHGELTVSVGDASFRVELDAEHATLADVRDAINNAADNKGVRATLINTAGGASLVLTSAKTGEDHAIKVASAGGDGGLAQLTYDPEGVMNLTELEPAQNGLIRIAELDIDSDTNVFENAIDGVTITALAATDGAEVALDVSFDATAVQARIKKFVSEYNAMQSQFARLGSYNAETKAAGPMLGDALLRAVEAEARRTLSAPIEGLTGDYTTLASIGVTTTATGALQLDDAKLTKALGQSPNAVAELFGGSQGVAAKLYDQIDLRLKSDGALATRDSGLKDEMKSITKDKEALTLRLEQIEARYRKQFTALDTLLSQMQSTSSYLTQQLANLPKSGG